MRGDGRGVDVLWEEKVGGERVGGESSEIKRVSEVGKWERAADIRIASRHMQAGRQAVGWGAAAPSLQQLGGRRARSRRRERQVDDVPLVACALSSLASDTSANRRRRCCATERLQRVLVLYRIVHGAAVYTTTAGWQVDFYQFPACARQCWLDVC